jgi:predicted permease
MRHELRSALRQFSRTPLFAATVLGTIALGIGPSAAVFSVVDAVLLRPLPYHDANRLIRVWGWDRTSDRRFLELTPGELDAVAVQAGTLAGVAAFSTAPRDFADTDGRATRVTVARVSSGFLALLGSSLELGRDFSDAEIRNQQPVVILSHGLWLARYGGRPDVVGRRVLIRGEAHEVVGVLRADQEFPQGVDLLRPIRDEELEDGDRELLVLGRLRPGVSIDRASVEVAALVARVAAREPASRGVTAWAQPLQSMLVKDVRAVLLTLLGAVGLVVLIVCVNVASLLMARATARRQEMAIRSAIGGGSRRLAALCLTESLALAGTGGLLGIALGHALLRGLVALVPSEVPRLDQVSLDSRATTIMAGVVLLCGLVFGSAPAWLESRQDLRSRTVKGGHRGTSLRSSLVVAQVVMSMVMVAGATQVATSFRHHLELDRGFRNLDLLELQVSYTGVGTPSSLVELYSRLRARLESVAEVRAVEMSSLGVMATKSLRLPVGVEGSASQLSPVEVNVAVISPGYARAIGLPVLAGRDLSVDEDRAGAAPVALVNRAFVAALLPGERAIGRRVQTPALSSEPAVRRIVGVVADVRPSVDSVPVPTLYVPFGQEAWPNMRLLVGMSGDDPGRATAAIRDLVWAEAPDLVVDDVGTLRDKVGRTVAAARLDAAVVGALAFFALALAGVGLYGLLVQFVGSRRRELAIRRAMGADERRLVRLVLRHGMALALGGVALGMPAALAATRLLSSSLFEVRWTNPAALVVPPFVVAAVAALACVVPALRALRIDPATALQQE